LPERVEAHKSWRPQRDTKINMMSYRNNTVNET